MAVCWPPHAAPLRQLAKAEGPGAIMASGTCNEIYRLTALHLHHVRREVPSRQRCLRGIEGHSVIRGFLMCVGAVDGSHIPIRALKVRPHDYHNRARFHYIVLQGTVDCSGRGIVFDTQLIERYLSSLDPQVGLTTVASIGTVTYTLHTSAVKGLHILHWQSFMVTPYTLHLKYLLVHEVDTPASSTSPCIFADCGTQGPLSLLCPRQ